MGVLLGQLPLAELGRLKAELAETLIANFCYPRFYDYRTESLRMRPVDSAKRKEVWLYLSAVDFTAWNRVDVMSPELQTYIERLFIHFVQRNRAFFGNQGRKRMADVRMLITTSAQAVAEGLRAHLASPQKKRSTFGSPRPVPSWATTHATPLPELGWEQISQSTLLLQQQLQELRGEAGSYEGRQVGASLPPGPGRPAIPLPATPTASGALAPGRAPAPAEERSSAAASAAPVSAPPTRRVPPIPSRALPGSPSAPAAAGPQAAPVRRPSGKLPQPGPAPQPAETSSAQAAASSTAPVPVQPRSPAGSQAGGRAPAPTPAEGTPLPANEDVTIFEEMRQQLVLWLRLEAVRLGLDISGQSPSQLIELLRRQDGFEQTRLQVISSLLNLITQVLKNGKASPMDYKQGLMFFLMHTRQLRP
ncbi:MAG: hypothetical protein IMW90_18480 [Thermogemmatispora sp.]|uniref:hypothetical protein n=1 Tax=Thermogemmatispora sp. TaxID=1968838 RepID=UPI0019EC5CDD|nr:hypothetical protein [Thermogemmatispora sp.]MBE3567707.1 hypothetical protein [Thermogemmatispora sp.]